MYGTTVIHFESVKETSSPSRILTLSEMRSHCRIVHTEDDTYLQLLHDIARQWIEVRYGNWFSSRSFEITIDEPAWDTFEFPSQVFPVTQITSVEDGSGTSLTYESYLYRFPQVLELTTFPTKVVIKGKAGWGDSEASHVPWQNFSPLQKGMMQLALADLYENRGDQPSKKTTERIDLLAESILQKGAY